MKEKHTLIADNGSSLMLPVTPMGVGFPVGKDYKVLNIAELGEYTVPGYRKLGNIRIADVLIPAERYPFCVSWTPQKDVLAWLERMAVNRNRLRYVVTGRKRPVSWPCYLTSVEPSREDGTDDVYVTLIFQACQSAAAPVTDKQDAVQRDDPLQETVTEEKTYTVKAGDCLWAICRTYYSDGSLATALASFNGIKNANIICVGQVLKIPQKSALAAGGSA